MYMYIYIYLQKNSHLKQLKWKKWTDSVLSDANNYMQTTISGIKYVWLNTHCNTNQNFRREIYTKKLEKMEKTTGKPSIMKRQNQMKGLKPIKQHQKEIKLKWNNQKVKYRMELNRTNTLVITLTLNCLNSLFIRSRGTRLITKK